MVSIGKQERELLQHLNNLNNERFNIKNYSRITGIARTTIYGFLYKLEKEGLITKEIANSKITEKGKNAIEILNQGVERGVGKPSLGVSESQNLSTHFHRFKLRIKDRESFEKTNLNRINPKTIRENNIHNLHQIIAYFQDATIIINPKQILIQVNELISDEVDKSDINSFNLLIAYVLKLKSVGLDTDEVTLEEGHWARMRSVFADFLFEKVDNHYFLEFEDGSKFWIDHSKGNREDETNDKELRNRMDETLKSLKGTKSTFRDVDQLVVLSSNLLEAQANEFSLLQGVNKSTAWLAENIESHGPVWFGMKDENRMMRIEAAGIRKEVRRLNAMLSQKKITEY